MYIIRFTIFCFILVTVNLAHSRKSDTCSRAVVEYLLPKAEQTHEILYVPGENVLLVTQFSSSTLIKATTVPGEGGITSVRGYPIGSAASGLHGLCQSKAYKNRVWVSLEKANKLLLLDPKFKDIDFTPEIIKTIQVPPPGSGPHHLAEYGTNLWSTLKASEHILRINHKNKLDYQLFKAESTPVILAQHPISKEIYATEFKRDTILRINPKTNKTIRIQVPAAYGQSPVALASDKKYTWVSLLSIKSNGTGGFGRISKDGTIKWFQMRTAIGKKAALLHIAVDPDEKSEPRPGIWLLASSIESSTAADMLIRAHFDKDFEKFDREEIVFLPSQGIKAHRISVSGPGIYVTELTSSRVAFYKRDKGGDCVYTFQNVELDGDTLI